MVYAAVGVSGSQKGDNFPVMDRVFLGPFDVTAFSLFLWAAEPEQWTGNGAIFFSSPRLSSASHSSHAFRARN